MWLCDVMSCLHGYSLDSMKIAMLGMSRDMWYDMTLDIPSFPPMAFHIEGFTLMSRRERPSSFTPSSCPSSLPTLSFRVALSLVAAALAA